MVDRYFRHRRLVAQTRCEGTPSPLPRLTSLGLRTMTPPRLVWAIPDGTPITDQPSRLWPEAGRSPLLQRPGP
jgi:hypothetical protein